MEVQCLIEEAWARVNKNIMKKNKNYKLIIIIKILLIFYFRVIKLLMCLRLI